MQTWWPLAIGLAVTAASGATYLLTAARDIVLGDTAELAAVALTLGVAHPPGYPLLTLLGYLFSLLPVGPEPFRLNVLVVICHTATVGVVYLTAWRLTGHPVASGISALLLAFNPLFWTWSLAFEAFALNDLLAAGLLYLVVVWHKGGRDESRPYTLVGAAFLAGLGIANHHTIALLGPAVLYVLWRRRARLLGDPRLVAACFLALVVGLLPYAYVPWAAAREPFWNWMGVSSINDFLALVTRQIYGGAQATRLPELAGGSAGPRLEALFASFGPLQLALLGLGAVGAYFSQRWYFWFTALAFGCVGPLFIAYFNVDITRPYTLWVMERFFVLPQVVVAPLAAVGLVFAAQVGGELARLRIADFGMRNRRDAASRLRIADFGVRNRVEVGLMAAALVAALVSPVLNYGRLDQSHNHIARRFAEDMLATVEPGAILVGSGDEMLGPLSYLQAVDQYRPDVTLIMGPLLTESWYVRQLRARHPDLALPFERLHITAGRMKQLVDANQGRPIWVVGKLLDEQSVQEAYWFYPRGLGWTIEPKGNEVAVAEIAAENERLYRIYRPPALSEIDRKSFERSVVELYAAPAYRVGQQYENPTQLAEARVWYERALAIDPELATARQALARLPP